MNTAVVTFEQVLSQAQQLSPFDQARLAARLAQVVERVLDQAAATSLHRPPLYGALADIGPTLSAEEIDEARREMWSNFPREDVGSDSPTLEATLAGDSLDWLAEKTALDELSALVQDAMCRHGVTADDLMAATLAARAEIVQREFGPLHEDEP